MNGKEFFNSILTTYFVLVTLITVSTLLTGLYMKPDATFGYEAFATPLIYAACGVLPSVIMYSKKELTIKQVLIRKIIQLVLIEILVFIAAFSDNSVANKKGLYSLGICVFVVFILVHLIDWLQNYVLAKQMTETLAEFQKNNRTE